MKQNYTFSILQYIYNELPITDHLESEDAISHDQKWTEEYVLLKSALKHLPAVGFYPKGRVLKNILSYSANTTA